MHPDLSKDLVRRQLEEAARRPGLLGPKVAIAAVEPPRFYVRFANVDGVDRVLRFDATNYDFQAIEVRLVDPETREELPDDRYMTRHGGQFPAHAMLGGRQFLCLDGTRDYYTHESHQPSVTGQRWETMRRSMTFADLLAAISKRFSSGEWR